MSGESLTKDQLREQLIANGIQLPPATAKKSVYVELYNNNIRNSHGHFSSDDDVHADSSSGRRTKKKRVIKQAFELGASDNLDNLTNSQIAAKLRQLGVKPGPIGQTTRNVYLKKLAKLLTASSEEKAAPDEKYSDDEKEDPVPTVPVTRSSSRRRTLVADNPPQVSTRRSLSLSNRTTLPNAPLVKSSSSGYNKRRSVAQTTLNENTSLTQPTICQSTPNLSYLSPTWKPSKDHSKTQNKPLASKPSTLPPISSIGLASPCELTPSWVNVSLSEVVEKSMTQSSDSGGFTLEKFSDIEEPFDVLDNETIAETSYNNTVINKAEMNHSTTLVQENTMCHNLTPIESQSKKLIPQKPQVKNVGFSSPDFATHARTSTRYETIVSPNHPPSSYLKRAQNVCGSATRRRPLRKTTNIPKTPERTEKLQQVQQETEQDGPAKPEEAAQSTSDERWVPVWAQIVITLILVAFFYLVLQYLEGNPPLPSLPGNNAKQ